MADIERFERWPMFSELEFDYFNINREWDRENYIRLFEFKIISPC